MSGPESKDHLIVPLAEDASIVSDVKFSNAPLEEEKKSKGKKRTHDEMEFNRKQLEEHEYNRELNEQRYKRLLHLLDKSKFYSSYLINKIEDNKTTKKKSKRPIINDENVPPTKKKIKKTDLKKYNIQEYMSKMKEEVKVKKKLNLSAEEIEAELIVDSDTEENVLTSGAAITPKYFCGNLRDYQQKGLQWLKTLYENALNGILADEMGLGKTIQVIAMICHLVEKKQAGPYMIIAPLSTIPNWLMEFERFAPAIPIVLLYGTKDERYAARMKIKQKHWVTNDYKTQPIVLTTYEIPLREVAFLQTQKWRYIVIDEGHRIKNYKCMLVKTLKTVKSMNRLILTGTPLQNNLAELWSLLNFLLPEIFDDLAVFESWFDVKELEGQEGTEKFLKQEEEKQVLSSLREILKPFMLRRVKADVCLEIPAKKELIVYAPITQLQHDLYKAVLNYDLETLSKIEKQDLIIETIDGKKLRRQSFLRNKYSCVKDNCQDIMSQSNWLEETVNNDNKVKQKVMKPEDQNSLSMWKQYTDVTERNKDFLVRIQYQNRIPMYKKIVNHPYLVHWPLDSVGLPKIDDDLIRSSGKLLVLDAMLMKLKAQGHKILLFSTMTMILDVIEDYLSLRNYNYVRLDGRTKIEVRKENIQIFNNDPDMFLFLISTRAGGVGLNLMSADTVIIYDSDWNPQADIQAMARCHRIGQTKPVVVYRLCTKGTIDEAIIKRSEIKRILEKIVISKEWYETQNINSKDTLLHLKQLMESKDYKIVTSENEVFTDSELDKLLDRGDMIQQS